MTYIEWRDRLNEKLKDMTEGQRRSILTEYAVRYGRLRDGGLSESEAVERLGTPQAAAAAVSTAPAGRENALLKFIFITGALAVIVGMAAAIAWLALVPAGLITGGVLTIIFAAITQSHTYFSTIGGIAITVAGAAAIPVAAVLIKLLARATGELYHRLADYIFDRAAA